LSVKPFRSKTARRGETGKVESTWGSNCQVLRVTIGVFHRGSWYPACFAGDVGEDEVELGVFAEFVGPEFEHGGLLEAEAYGEAADFFPNDATKWEEEKMDNMPLILAAVVVVLLGLVVYSGRKK